MKILRLLFVVCLIYAGASISTQAAELAIDLNKIKPLSELELIPAKEFENQTSVIEVTPYDDEFLAYQVRLPEGWQETTANLNAINIKDESGVAQNVLGVVSRYVSPAKNYMRSIFTVEAVELIHEIDARNWFIHYILKSGLALEQVGLEKDGEVEALYIEVQGDTTYAVRVRAVLNGPRMVLARYYLPVELYKKEAIQQAQVLSSFELINRQDVNIEQTKIHGFISQSYFDYPVSWQIIAPIVRSVERMEAQLLHRDKNGKLSGQINVFLVSKSLNTSRSEELSYYKDLFNIEGYDVHKLIEKIETDYHENMNFGVTQAYSMKSSSSQLVDYELWVSVLENEDYYYIISLFTPSRKDDFYTWARNSQSYKLLLSNIRLESEGADIYQYLE